MLTVYILCVEREVNGSFFKCGIQMIFHNEACDLRTDEVTSAQYSHYQISPDVL